MFQELIHSRNFSQQVFFCIVLGLSHYAHPFRILKLCEKVYALQTYRQCVTIGVKEQINTFAFFSKLYYTISTKGIRTIQALHLKENR